MKDFTVEEIDNQDFEKAEPILSKSGVISNFTCFPQFYSFVKKTTSKIFIAHFNDEKRLIVCKANPVVDIRIMFNKKKSDKILIRNLKDKYNPKYIAYNLISNTPRKGRKHSCRSELVMNVNCIAGMKDTKLSNAYRRCVRKHPNLKYVSLENKCGSLINRFLDEWCLTAGAKLHQNTDAENDRNLIRQYLCKSVLKGGLAIDGNKIVGLAIHTYHPSDRNNLATKTILKNLRGYSKLGQWLVIEEAKQLKAEGYSYALMGGDEVQSQKHFKYQFMQSGKVYKYFSYEVYREAGLTLHKNYLRDIWD